MTSPLSRRRLLCMGGALGLSASAAWGQSAAGTLRIIVATPAGGASDAAARLLGQALSKRTGQAVVVENRPGGNGVPAMLALLAAPPDGQTLLWAMSSMAGMPMLMKSSPIRSLSELVPVSSIVQINYGLVLSPKVPAQNLGEFNAYLKANPGRLNYATGPLSEYMIATQYLRHFGLDAQRVPYKGGVPVIPDLINGEVHFYFGALSPLLPQVRAGKLRLLATLPDPAELVAGVPSMSSVGVKTDNIPSWNGLMAPPRTPLAAAQRLANEVHAALGDGELRTSLEGHGFRVVGSNPAQMAHMVETAGAAWKAFVRDYDIPQE